MNISMKPNDDGTFTVSNNQVFMGDSLIYNDYTVNIDSIVNTINDSIFLKQKIYLPLDYSGDYSNPIILLSKFNSSVYITQPIISYLIDLERPIVPFQYRGMDDNKQYKQATLKTDSDDLLIFLKNYSDKYAIKSLDLDIWAESYGGIVAVTTPYNSKDVVDKIVFESTPVDFVNTLKDMPDALEMAKTKDIRDTLDFSSLLDVLSPSEVMYIYGSKDDGIRKDDIQRELNQTNVNSSFIELEKMRHIIRFGFPMSQDDFDELNAKIVNFFR
jgi:hypothetical protein